MATKCLPLRWQWSPHYIKLQAIGNVANIIISEMNATPKTIQIFLPGGDPQGIRVAELTTRIVLVIEVPRSRLSEFLAMPESDQVAVYFLVGSDDDGDTRQVYIGQTGDLKARLMKHNKEKDFWERALVLISRTQSLTQTHALFLEWHCLQAVKDAGRYEDKNGNSGSRPHTPTPMEADCIEVFDTGKTLLSTLGYPLFTPVGKPSGSNEEELFFCKSQHAEASGLYTEEGFVVYQGSKARLDSVQSIGFANAKMRARLKQSNVLSEEDGLLVFQKDYLFRSPSSAAIAVLGRTANGWIEWKRADGKTLDELKRQ